MLVDMVPIKSANYQLVFTGLGILACTLALLLKEDIIFKIGASFLIVGASFLTHSLFYMTNI